MESDLKKAFEKLSNVNGFIKSTNCPISSLSDDQKVKLNRKGNMLFNSGKITEAQRIFQATGYSDGLTRVGDFFVSKNKELEALKLYLLAHNKRKSDPIIEKISGLISQLIREPQKTSDFIGGSKS